MKKVLVVVAHSDDQILGPGGTLAKLAKEGAIIKTIIFSYGELSNPHMKKEVISKIRVEEAEKGDKIIGGSGVEFLGIKEGNFLKECEPTVKLLEKIIKQFKPNMIFTHSIDEFHADHRAVIKLLLQAYDNIKPDANMYCFDVWNPVSFGMKNQPKLVVNISEYFDVKRRALNVFKSQKHALLLLIWSVYVRALLNGIRYKVKLAEVFYKLR